MDVSHVSLRSGYTELVERLNRFPQGAPPSETLYQILKILFSEQEAGLVAQLPIKPFTAAQASRILKMDLAQTQQALDALSSRAILVDTEHDGQITYTLPPPMAGFFEFSMMRLRGDIDQKVLAELFYQYMNVEEDFIKDLFCEGETRLGRTFIYEPAIPKTLALHVLDHERATEVINKATHRAVGVCYCRHKMSHVGKACDAPLDICMTFNGTAESLIRHKIGRSVDVSECMDLLHQAYDCNLVQIGENGREDVNFICNCCGCCCEAMIAARRFGLLHPVHTTNFLPEIQEDACTGCGQCINVCPVEAMSLVSASNPRKPQTKKARLREEICLGCGLCIRACRDHHIALKFRPQRVITPLNSVHQTVVMAIERGKLQNLIFDNQALFSHRAMAAILGVILKLPPVKQAMASRQVKSRYLEALIKRMKTK